MEELTFEAVLGVEAGLILIRRKASPQGFPLLQSLDSRNHQILKKQRAFGGFTCNSVIRVFLVGQKQTSFLSPH